MHFLFILIKISENELEGVGDLSTDEQYLCLVHLNAVEKAARDGKPDSDGDPALSRNQIETTEADGVTVGLVVAHIQLEKLMLVYLQVWHGENDPIIDDCRCNVFTFCLRQRINREPSVLHGVVALAVPHVLIRAVRARVVPAHDDDVPVLDNLVRMEPSGGLHGRPRTHD